MSKQLINNYYNQLHAVKRSGATNEGAISLPFFFLVQQYAQTKKYNFVSQVTLKSKKTAKNIRPDGVLMNDLRIHRGYWESKDADDDIDTEINKKLHKDGYPDNNILFEDSITAVLIQGSTEVMRVQMQDADALDKILSAFINYKPAEIIEFEKALEEFKKDIPEIAETFRKLFDEQDRSNLRYQQARDSFLELCQNEINPDITVGDIREMLIQHILTEDLFTAIFDDGTFLKYNVIAKELENLIATVLTREVRQNQLADIRHYYQTLNATAAALADHHEKQQFLKTVYENFYKVYNPKGADRLGVVYTPNEIVRFMIESADYLLEKHFNKNLHDSGVEILDPATGTGTFITDLIDYLPPQYLEHKYKNEIFANEVSILPYYIANLNIEYTYKNKMGAYVEFPNICFVDTLDNTGALSYAGKQQAMFALSSENAERIKRQNQRKLSVIIGNPPYNANQQSFNDFNQNRAYPDIDKRIKDTFVKQSSATNKANVYDMYTRFYRWAMDRIDKNGVICFITNSSFIESRAFDGFRKSIEIEFDYAYIIDLGGDIRKLSGKDGIWLNEENTIFGISAAVGIAILWLVKCEDKAKKQGKCKINYIHPCDIRATRIEKLEWLKSHHFSAIRFENITPSEKYDWINLSDNDFDSLMPLISKDAKNKNTNNTLFKLYSLGVNTNRDEWVYDFNKDNLSNKMQFFVTTYNSLIENHSNELSNKIKWSSSLEDYFKRKLKGVFSDDNIMITYFRPFTKKWHYKEKIFNHRLTQQHYSMFGKDLIQKNLLLCLNVNGKGFYNLISNILADLHFTGDSQCLPLYTYNSAGNRQDNITEWGLQQFRNHYQDASISKEAIFAYVYAVLHYPVYRERYEQNLKRDFPRIPFYPDFNKWAVIGQGLIDLHIGYEQAAAYPLGRTDKQVNNAQAKLKVKLKANPLEGSIEIDEQTRIDGIPEAAWAYKLGNRSALEWVLDQYKEKTPADDTIREQFNTYRFADYKEDVIALLAKLCTVSVETMELIKQLK